MTSFWLFCVIVSFCYASTQLQIVLAAEKELESKSLDNWKNVSCFNGNADLWDYRNNSLVTPILAGGGTSCFTTPLLRNIPNTSYLDIEASCSNNPCQLEIYGSSNSSFKGSQHIQNVMFTNRSFNTATIKKSYTYLHILARATSRTTFKIYSIKMYHYFCENTTIYNTVLSQVDSSTTNISKIVQCGDNAVASDGNSTNITVNCTPKGNWTFGDQKCLCVEGFQSDNEKCSDCSTDYYKNIVGNEKCLACPAGKTNNTMHTRCQCKEDYYIGRNESGPCYAVPPKVVNLNVKLQLTNTSVNVTWRKPDDNDSLSGFLTYIVKWYRCINVSKCDTNETGKSDLNTTYAIVDNLTLYTTYKIKVFSISSILQNVTVDKWKFEELNFTLAVLHVTIAPKTTVTTEPNKSDPKGTTPDNQAIIVSLIIVLIILLIILLVLVLCLFRAKVTQIFENLCCKANQESQEQTEGEGEPTGSRFSGNINEVYSQYSDYDEIDLQYMNIDDAEQQNTDESHYTDLETDRKDPENTYQPLEHNRNDTEVDTEHEVNSQCSDYDEIELQYISIGDAEQQNTDESHYTDLETDRKDPEITYQPLERNRNDTEVDTEYEVNSQCSDYDEIELQYISIGDAEQQNTDESHYTDLETDRKDPENTYQPLEHNRNDTEVNTEYEVNSQCSDYDEVELQCISIDDAEQQNTDESHYNDLETDRKDPENIDQSVEHDRNDTKPVNVEDMDEYEYVKYR